MRWRAEDETRASAVRGHGRERREGGLRIPASTRSESTHFVPRSLCHYCLQTACDLKGAPDIWGDEQTNIRRHCDGRWAPREVSVSPGRCMLVPFYRREN